MISVRTSVIVKVSHYFSDSSRLFIHCSNILSHLNFVLWQKDVLIQGRCVTCSHVLADRSIQESQMAYQNKFLDTSTPQKSSIQKLVEKRRQEEALSISMRGAQTVQSYCTGCKQKLLPSSSKSLCSISEETWLPNNVSKSCQESRTACLHVLVVQVFLSLNKESNVQFYLWFQLLITQRHEILDVIWFTDEVWFLLNGYTDSRNTFVGVI
jgi:hypothetical protein